MLVSTNGDKASVIAGDGEIENGVAMRGITLDETGFGDVEIRFQGTVKVDSAVRGAGKDLMS